MIIDVNAFLGHYPFRRLRYTTAAAMIDHMDAHGIDVAVVSSLHSVFYRDAQRGNEELFEETQKYPGRLIPIATVNPKYVGWERDLRFCLEQGHSKAVALFPEHHGYRLTDGHGQAALRRIEEIDLPIVLTQRLEDRRQRHHWDVAEDLTVSTLLEIAAAHPKLRFMLCNWIGLDGAKLLAAGLRGRCLIDFARLHVVMNKDVPKLVQLLGVEAMAFGSHMPFDYLSPSLIKLANVAELFPEHYEQVASRNAAQFFRIPLPERG